MSQFAEFLASKKIEAKQLLLASAKAERLTEEDEKLYAERIAKRIAAGEKKESAYEGIAKPRSGRPITEANLADAEAGNKQPRKVRGKLLRAVNAVLAARKQDAVDTKALFGTAGRRYGHKPVVKKK